MTLARAFRKCSGMWAHRQTIIGGKGEPDDRQVLFNRRPVGRVYYAPNMLPEMRWSWACGSAHGYVETMAEALEKVRKAYLSALEQNAPGT